MKRIWLNQLEMSNMEVMLKNVRIAFWNGFKAKKFGSGDGEPRFSTAMFIEPGSDNDKAVEEAILTVAKEKWEKKAAAILSTIRGSRKTCFYFKGTLTNDEGEPYEGAEGFYTVNAGQPESKGAPLVIDARRDASGQFPVLTAKDGKPYSGCYCNIKIDVWAQDNDFGKAIRASLVTVQFSKNGDAFGGNMKKTSDGFEEVEEEGSDADDLS